MDFRVIFFGWSLVNRLMVLFREWTPGHKTMVSPSAAWSMAFWRADLMTVVFLRMGAQIWAWVRLTVWGMGMGALVSASQFSRSGFRSSTIAWAEGSGWLSS